MPTLAKESRLEVLEKEINTEAFEAFYHIGQKLLEIKTKCLYENVGFKTWGAYCASGRIDYKRSQADVRIRVSELRPKLPEIPAGNWSVGQVEELCKCETDNDAKRVARKVISLAKKTKQRVTAKLIVQVRDGQDETNAAGKRRDAELEEASLANHLDDLSDTLVEWRTSLEEIDLEQWSDPDPDILARARTEARKLLKLLESRK